jgi:hypothetical protein
MANQVEAVTDIIRLYEAGPDCLEAVVSQLVEKDLDLALTRGEWTIRQYIHHLADGEDIWKGFIKRAIGHPGAGFSLEWYWQVSQDTWARNWCYADRPIEPSVALIRASRAHVAQLLRAAPGALEKGLMMKLPDKEEELLSVRGIIEMQTRHLEGHIKDIQRILGLHYQRTTPI